MAEIAALLPVLLPCAAALAALLRGVDVFAALTDGARRGLELMGRVLPSLAVLLPCVAMLRASGALAALEGLLAPAAEALGVPRETVSLMLIRPLSGSGALAVGGEIMAECGVNSPAGRTAAVMLGSTETTFYVLSVYFGAAGVRKSRHAAAAALCADLAGFLTAAWWVRQFG